MRQVLKEKHIVDGKVMLVEYDEYFAVELEWDDESIEVLYGDEDYQKTNRRYNATR